MGRKLGQVSLLRADPFLAKIVTASEFISAIFDKPEYENDSITEGELFKVGGKLPLFKRQC